MNQFGATLLIVETLFIQTVNRLGRYWSNIRHRVCVPYANVNRLTSAYIFRLFRNSLRSILRSRRFTGYGTASEGERISGISIRVPARRKRPEFAFDSQSGLAVTPLG